MATIASAADCEMQVAHHVGIEQRHADDEHQHGGSARSKTRIGFRSLARHTP